MTTNWNCSRCAKDSNYLTSVAEGRICQDCFASDQEDKWNCKECGKIETAVGKNSKQGPHLKGLQICSSCDFWIEKVNMNKTNPELRQVIIEGTHYIAGAEVEKPGWGNGYSGEEFKILQNNRIVTTNNLWCQGEIPERFRDRLKDNAEFVRE